MFALFFLLPRFFGNDAFSDMGKLLGSHHLFNYSMAGAFTEWEPSSQNI